MNKAVLIYKNFITGSIPPTPISLDVDSELFTDCDEKLLEYAGSIGQPIGYQQEQKGSLVQNIFPIKQTEAMQISSSSKVELGLHTETAFHPYKPDIVVLLCVRGDPTGITTISEAADVVSKLDKHVINELCKPNFLTSLDPSFMLEGEQDASIPITVLNNTDGQWHLVYDETLVTGTTDEAAHALVHLKKAIRESVVDYILDTGDLMLINNNMAVHGRKPFVARYDGTDRWLKRVLIRTKNTPSSDIEGNVINTKFY
jgi:L-asparagine oxygenase